MEKLQLLKTPEERRRRLEEIPEIHADPKMDPSYESDDNDSENEDSRRGFIHVIFRLGIQCCDHPLTLIVNYLVACRCFHEIKRFWI